MPTRHALVKMIDSAIRANHLDNSDVVRLSRAISQCLADPQPTKLTKMTNFTSSDRLVGSVGSGLAGPAGPAGSGSTSLASSPSSTNSTNSTNSINPQRCVCYTDASPVKAGPRRSSSVGRYTSRVSSI